MDAPFVVAYDDLVGGPLAQYLRLSGSIGGLVQQQAEMVAKAVQIQRQFLVIASTSQRPSDQELMNLLKPTADQINAIQELRNKNRTSELFNHLSAISESIPALGWVTVAPTPGPYVKEMVDASQFYTNKVLVAYKDKDKSHCDWTRSWLSFLSDLQAYIKQYHTTGLVWNPRGGSAVAAAGAAGAVTNGSGAPPPPPPPPPAFDLLGDSKPQDDTRTALLRDLNKGTDITKGLKKVAPEMQTHKNPNLRASAVVPASAAGNVPSARSKPAPAVQKPPKFELEGKKWMIEYVVGRRDLIVDQTEMNQSVNVYRCQDCLIQIKGKINSITIDECKKVSLVFDDIVAMVEFINSRNIQAQTMGKVPTISVDKTDGVQIYLCEKSLDCEIVSSKSSELNVSVPDPVTKDFVEHAIPEQFKSVFDGKKFRTEAVEMA